MCVSAGSVDRHPDTFTHAALTAHGVTIDAEGFGYVRSRKRKIDCNAVYKLLDEGLWWPLLAGKRLAIISGHADALAAKLLDTEFVRATGGDGVSWSIETVLSCPSVSELKRSHWPQLREQLFAADWELLLCSAGSLSAIVCEAARSAGCRAIDIGALDTRILCTRRRNGVALGKGGGMSENGGLG